MLKNNIKVKLSQEQYLEFYSNLKSIISFNYTDNRDLLCQLIIYKLAKKVRTKLEENKIKTLTLNPDEALALLAFYGLETDIYSPYWAKGVYIINRATQCKLNVELTLLEARI